MTTVKEWWARFQQMRPYRAWKRFGDSRGNLLSAGIGFYGFFSIFPAVAIAAIVFGLVLNGRPELLAAVGDSLNTTLPGFIKTASNPQGLVELKPPAVSALTLGGVVALVSLLLSGIGWIGALRDGIRTIFGAQGSPGNLLTDKLRDLGTLVTLGAAVLVSAVLTSVLGSAASWISEHVGIGDHPVVVQAVGFLVGYAVDAGILVVLLRVLSGVPLPWRDVRQAALVGALGFGIVKLFGVALIGNATKNPVFGSLVLVVGLLFWLNLVAKLVLLSASWAANDIDLTLAALESSTGGKGGSTEEAVVSEAREGDLTDERARAVAGIPTFGARTQDRTTLAAGAVLGATAAFALGTLGRTVRAVVWRR